MMTDGHQAVLAAARSWVDAADEPGRERVRVAVLEALRSVNGPGDGSELAALDAAIAAASACDTEAQARQALAGVDIHDRDDAPLDVCESWGDEPPDREWLIDAWLPAGRVTMMTGTGGAGKSRLSIQLLSALARGESKWLPGDGCQSRLLVVPTSGAVGVLASWEDERDHVARLLHRMDVADKVGDRFHFYAPRGPVWATGDGGHISRRATWTRAGRKLLDYAARADARLLVLDPIAAAFGSDENSRALVREFVASLDAWAQEHGCAVLLLAHPAKSESSDYSGSTDWQAAVRALWVHASVKDPSAGPGDRDTSRVPALTLLKTSYAAKPTEPLYLANEWPLWSVVQKPRAVTAAPRENRFD